MKKLLNRFHSMGIRVRFVFVFALLIIIPLIFQVLSLSALSGRVLDRYKSEMDLRFSLFQGNASELYNECRRVLFDFAYNSEIQSILKDEYKDENLVKSRYVVEMILRDGRLNSGIAYSIFVYDTNGDCYTNDYIDMISYEDVVRDGHVADTHIFANMPLTGLMREQNYSNLIMARPIFDDTGRRRIGTVVIRIDARHVGNLYKEVFEGSDADVTVVDEGGIVISSDTLPPGSPAAGQLDLPFPLPSDLVDERENDIIFISGPGDNGWSCIAQVDRDVVASARNEMMLNTYISTAVMLGLAVLALLYITTSIVAPIRLLTDSMEAVESADSIELTFKPKYDDEIGRMARSFNNMTVKLKNSVEKIKKIESEKQTAEMKMLQAQISPHFLYNTLSSVIWLIHRDRKEDAIDMMDSLARLYQISLSRGREFITVREEFSHAESYLKIQEKRYSGDFTYEILLDEAIAGRSVIKVVLQPLIENAIYHGIKNGDGPGRIIVRGSLAENGRMLFEIMDSADILGEEGCRRMNEGVAGRAGVLGVGVSNVVSRLKLFYGSDCSIRYASKDGFTVVSIEIAPGEEQDHV